jgi:hypothetical protein
MLSRPNFTKQQADPITKFGRKGLPDLVLLLDSGFEFAAAITEKNCGLNQTCCWILI